MLSAQSTDQKRMTVSPDKPITLPSTEPFAPSTPSSGDSSPDPALIGPSSGVHFGQDIQLQSDKTVEQIQLILGILPLMVMLEEMYLCSAAI